MNFSDVRVGMTVTWGDGAVCGSVVSKQPTPLLPQSGTVTLVPEAAVRSPCGCTHPAGVALAGVQPHSLRAVS